MSRIRIDVGSRCQFRCPYCVSWRQPDQMRPLDEMVSALANASTSDDVTVVLDGGEPTLHPDILPLVRHIVESGGASIELHTNAVRVDVLRSVAATAQRRLTCVVRLDSLDPSIAAALAGVDDALPRTVSGLEALLDAGVPTYLQTCVTAANAASLPDFVVDVADRWPDVRGIRLAWYAPRAAEQGRAVADPLYIAPPRAERAVARALARAGAAKLSFSLDWPVAPCLFARPERVAGLFARGRGLRDAERRGPCAVCLYASRCDGPNATVRAHASRSRVRPITEASNRALAVGAHSGGALDGERDVLVSESGTDEVVIRTTDRCNQRCPFCSALVAAPADVPEELLRRRVERAVALRPRRIAVSGGEPTLLPDRLVSLVAELRKRTESHLRLQTNATLVGRGELARKLVEAGLDDAFVSLHAHTPADYDQQTASRGLFPEALSGIHALLDAGLVVYVNHVLTAGNISAFPDFARFLADRFGTRARLNLSLAHPIGAVLERFHDQTPRLSELAGPLREGLDFCLERGVAFGGLAGPAGIPLCVLDADERYYGPLALPPRPSDDNEYVKGPPCQTCRVSDLCLGLRRYQATLHGFSDLRPV